MPTSVHIRFYVDGDGATGDDLDHDGDGSAYDDIDDDSDGVAGDEIDVMAMKSTMMATARNFVTMVLLPS
jgi:hypothetical protein